MAAAVAAVVLAAGQGTRMKSDTAKVLHRLAGRPMVEHIVDALAGAGVEEIVLVVGWRREDVMTVLGDRVQYVTQEPQLGTGHAVMQAKPLVTADTVVVANGDCPLLRTGDITRLVAHHRETRAAATMVTVTVDNPGGYGRIVREQGRIRVVEEKNATEQERLIREINTGVYCFQASALWDALSSVQADEVTGEYYLVDVFPVLSARREPAVTLQAEDPDCLLGVNDRAELARAETLLNRRTLERLMRDGVTIVDPATTRVVPEAEIGPDVVIHPFTVIEGRTRVESGAEIGPGSLLRSSHVGTGSRVVMSVVERSVIGDGCQVGPFSHLRPDSVLAEGVKVGNFAEIKNSKIGSGSKVPHHSYVGDSTVGERVNIGAGTVTVNYDGVNKYRTEIGSDAFIGCNSNLVAPVVVGPGAYTAAGSTITRDVPARSLAVSRSRQTLIPEWVERRMKKRPGDGDDRG